MWLRYSLTIYHFSLLLNSYCCSYCYFFNIYVNVNIWSYLKPVDLHCSHFFHPTSTSRYMTARIDTHWLLIYFTSSLPLLLLFSYCCLSNMCEFGGTLQDDHFCPDRYLDFLSILLQYCFSYCCSLTVASDIYVNLVVFWSVNYFWYVI